MERKYLIVTVMILIVVAIFISANAFQTVNNAKSEEGTAIGNKAPDFSLQTPEGEKISLSDFQGRAVIVNFWATWCPPCRAEMPEFQKLYAPNQDKLTILAINLQEPNVDGILAFKEELGFSYPILLDPDALVKKKYNVFTQPVTYFIDRNGIIVDKKLGPLTVAELNEKTEKILG
jgi:peroxiredoxin